MLTNKPEDLTIHGFTDRKRRKKAGNSPFVCKINPITLKTMVRNNFFNARAINSSGSQACFGYGNVSRMEVQLIFDSSGIADDTISMFTKPPSLPDQIEKFMKLCYRMNGDIHQPNFLKLSWGTLIYECRLESVNIDYKKFNRFGVPVQADLITVFIEDVDDEERIKREGKNSPDLTHVRDVKAGDTLPLLCHEIYKSPDYYPQVAEHNNLDHFREIAIGQTLHFPPLEELLENV